MACGAEDDRGEGPAPTEPAPAASTTTEKAPEATTTAVPTTPAPADLAALPCPAGEGRVVGAVPAALPELSGLAVSRGRPSLLWGHNDSGNAAALYAFSPSPDGAVVTELTVGSLVLDGEDVASATAPDGTAVLWLADTGDNFHLRPAGVLFRIPEPDGEAWPAEVRATGVSTISVVYPGGKRPNIEALMVDPLGGDLLLVAKDVETAADGRRTAAVYRVGADEAEDGRADAELVTAIEVPDDYVGPTGADVAADGSLIVVRTASTALLWPSLPGVAVVDRLALTPAAPCRVALVYGEAVALNADGREMTVGSEGAGSELMRFTFV